MANLNQKDLTRIVEDQLGLDNIRPDEHFLEDLGLESSDFANLVVTIEEAYQVELPDERIKDVFTIQAIYDLLNDLLNDASG